MATIQKWGNRLAVRIPASMAAATGGDRGVGSGTLVREGELVVRPARFDAAESESAASRLPAVATPRRN